MNLLGGEQELGGEAVCLVFDGFAARFGFTVHHQVTQLVGNVETLSVVVPLEGVQDDGGPVGGCERVRVDSCGAWWAEHDEYAVGFEKADLVAGRASVEFPRFANMPGGFVGPDGVAGLDMKLRHLGCGELSVNFNGRRDIDSNLAVGESLVSQDL